MGFRSGKFSTENLGMNSEQIEAEDVHSDHEHLHQAELVEGEAEPVATTSEPKNEQSDRLAYGAAILTPAGLELAAARSELGHMNRTAMRQIEDAQALFREALGATSRSSDGISDEERGNLLGEQFAEGDQFVSLQPNERAELLVASYVGPVNLEDNVLTTEEIDLLYDVAREKGLDPEAIAASATQTPLENPVAQWAADRGISAEGIEGGEHVVEDVRGPLAVAQALNDTVIER